MHTGTSFTADADPHGVQQRLIAAATAEFVAQGYHGASVSRIIDRARCNVRMIYHYFGNKDGLYRACLERIYGDLREAEAQATFWDASPAEAIADLTRFTFDYMIAHPEFQGMMRIENMVEGQNVRAMVQINRRAGDLFARIDALLAHGVAAGDFAHHPDAGELYLTILGLATIHTSNRYTMGVVMGQDLASPAFLEKRREAVPQIILSWLRAADAA